MNKFKIKTISIILCLTFILTCGLSACGLHNLPPDDGRLTYLSDPIIKNENIKLTQHNLTFNILELPKSSYSSESEFLDLSSSVSSEYTFYNQTNTDLIETAYFQVGSVPDYGIISSDDEKIQPDDIFKYSVFLNDTSVNFSVRHFFPYETVHNDNFDKYFIDDFYADQIVSPETVVKKFNFSLSEKYYPDKDVYVCLPYNQLDGVNFLLDDHIGNLYFNSKCYVTALTNKSSFCLYVIGNPNFDATNLAWTVRDFDHNDDAYDQLPITINLSSYETLNLKQLMLSFRPKDSKVSEVDWYNCATLNCIDNSNTSSIDLTDQIISYIKYDIFVPALSSVKNTITAPIYPLVYNNSSPYAFNYIFRFNQREVYLESRNIYLRTPFYIVKDTDFYNSVDEKLTEDGYQLTNKGHVTVGFTLCSSKNPLTRSDRIKAHNKKIGIIILLFFMVITLTPITALILLILHFRKKEKAYKKEKQNLSNNENYKQ